MKPPEKMVEKIVATLTDHVRDVLEEELARTVPSVEELGVKLSIARVENAQLRAAMKRILKACPHEDFAPTGCGCRWCVARRMVHVESLALGEALEAIVAASRTLVASCECPEFAAIAGVAGGDERKKLEAALAAFDAVIGG